jgi:aminoglycoside 6'-N-acetyltransferase I
MDVRTVTRDDAAEWERLRQSLWPSKPGQHAGEITAFFDGDRRNPAEVFLAVSDDDPAIGFAEVSIRDYAEGCASDRVAYLEGWFVEASHRRGGVGEALVAAVERWARSQGCTELASDTGIDNAASAEAHRALGFTEVERIVCFRKDL